MYLRRALVAALAVPALLLVAAAWFDHARLREAQDARATGTVRVLREHALVLLRTEDVVLRMLQQRLHGLDWAAIRAQRERLLQELHAAMAEAPEVSDIALLDAAGRAWIAVAANAAPPPGDDLSDRAYFTTQRDDPRGGETGMRAGELYFSAALVSRWNGEEIFALSRPRQDPQGGFGGVVKLAFRTRAFTDVWADTLRSQPGVAVSLQRLDGQMLARFPAPAGQLPQVATAGNPVFEGVARGQDSGTAHVVSAITGQPGLLAWDRVPGFPVVLTCTVFDAEVLQVWRGHVAVLALIALAVQAGLAAGIATALRQTRALARETAQREAVEQAAREGQRLEVLGQLAAGVAHDFRNLLQAARGAAALIESHTAEERTRRLAGTVSRAAERGEALTQRLVAIARRDPPSAEAEREVLEPAAAVAETCHMLGSVLGRDWRLTCELDPDAPHAVRGNRTELERTLMNLVVNARDAMPRGGVIRVHVGAASVAAEPERPEARGEPAERAEPLPPGRYGTIAVIDSGGGMSAEVLARAGTLFFTTKPRGHGTGLGLAAARGFAERAGGRIDIASREGAGTTVTLWLPEAAALEVA